MYYININTALNLKKKFSKSEAFYIFLNAITFLLNLMSGLRAFHILETLTHILNDFFRSFFVSYFANESSIFVCYDYGCH